MKRKDITTKMVLLAYIESKKTKYFPYDILMRETNAPFKVVWSAMKRDYDKGFINACVSLRSGWLTEKGYEFLNNNKI